MMNHRKDLPQIIEHATHVQIDAARLLLEVIGAVNALPSRLRRAHPKGTHRSVQRDAEVSEDLHVVGDSLFDGDVQITRQLVSLIMGGQFAREMALLLEGF